LTDVQPILKPIRVKKNGHPWACKCRSCVGSRNRTRGLRKQREAARAAGIEARRMGDLSNEERYSRTGLGEMFKLEHKYGNLSKFVMDAIGQIERDRATGDPRAPMVQVTPKGSSKVYCIVAQDDLQAALANQGPDGAYHIRRNAQAIAKLAKTIEEQAT
jgi:hypothetical protein